ncbi:MAG: TetR/AcrR family transcriptional regulator [Chthoniobacterales bacterium]|nr:TetR/AcrR family transcriptional regulator [Chthoniobacterales bacterium]
MGKAIDNLRAGKAPRGPRPTRGKVKARLLTEAIRLFAAGGYDGVSVDEIVQAAEVNKRMVYHYFGNKEGIYRAALGYVFFELQKQESERIASYGGGKADPEEGMRILVGLYFTFLDSHPEFVRLLLWENLGQGRHLAQVEVGMSKSPILGHVKTLLQEGVAQGVFRPGLDARLVLTSLIGLSLIYHSNRFTLLRSVGMDFNKPGNMVCAAEHAAIIFLSGLRADAAAVDR